MGARLGEGVLFERVTQESQFRSAQGGNVIHMCPDYEPCVPCIQREAFDAGVHRGAAVAFELMGMAEAIRNRDPIHYSCLSPRSQCRCAWTSGRGYLRRM